MRFVLVGAGGHAKAVVETVRDTGDEIIAYVDPHRSDWLDLPHYDRDEDLPADAVAVVLGIGGVTPDALSARLALLDTYLDRGFAAPATCHASGIVSATAVIEDGAIVLAGAIIQPAARIGRGAIANTGAIVEHDAIVGPGAHVAPGAIVLGGCSIGRCAMIGARAVVLPGAEVPDGTLVAAATRYPQ